MADSLQEMAVFARVVGAGSLSAAARDLGVSTAVVSRKLAALESRLGVRLINRTTRSLHLTDEGASYLRSLHPVLAEIEEADAAVAAGRGEPQGALRVALPASFGNQHVAPLIPRFAARYPEGAARAQPFRPQRQRDRGRLRPRGAHRRAGGFLARRAQARAQPARGVRQPRRTCAATARRARPRICRSTTASPRSDFTMNWDYRDPDGKPGSVRVTGRYACDNWEVLREWALAGLGVALKSTWDVRRHLEDGSLVALLPGYTFASDVAI